MIDDLLAAVGLTRTRPAGGPNSPASTELETAPAPDSVLVEPQHVRIGDSYAATFAVTGYPAEVTPGWLEPLLSYPGRLDVSLHIEPVPPPVAADRLRKQRARLESGRAQQHQRGRLDDPALDAAASDAAELAGRIARGEGKLFRVGLYLTVHAQTRTQLAADTARVKALAASLLLELQPTTWRALQGWTTSLPLAVDAIKLRRTMDTAALAAAFPFTSPDLPKPSTVDREGRPAAGPVLYGTNTYSAGVVVWDRWSADNHNSITLARSGAGKSYFTKLDLLRNLYHGVAGYVIDPENEYIPLTRHVGGTVIALGAPGVRLNPLDLPTTNPQPDALARRGLFLHTLIGVLLGRTLSPQAAAALDRAVTAAYHHAGITSDPRTWRRPAPLLCDVTDALTGDTDPVGAALASYLAPYTTGTFRGLFDGPSTATPDGHLVTFTLRDTPDEMLPAATLLALDAVWRNVATAPTGTRSLVVVDEAWLLLRTGAGADWLYKLAKRARKYAAGLALVTQDVSDMLSTDLGRAVAANAATQVLLRQAPQAIEQVCDAFDLTAGERAVLLAARRGDGLLVAGRHRVGFHALASPAEHAALLAHDTNHGDVDPGPWPGPGADGDLIDP